MIYCNGDSFTHGTELYDHIFFKDIHPGFIMNKDMFSDRAKSIQECYHSTIAKIKCSDEECNLIEAEAKRMAWPAKLEKLLNIQVINGAFGGSSMDGVCYRTITDIVDLKRKGETIDLAILQVTFAERFDIYINDKEPFSINANMQLDAKKIGQTAVDYAKIRIANETPFSLYKNLLFNLIYIFDFFKANNIPYLVIESIPTGVPMGKYDILKNLEDYINLKFDFSMYELSRNLPKDALVFCSGGHFAEPVHFELAKEIANLYENRFRH